MYGAFGEEGGEFPDSGGICAGVFVVGGWMTDLKQDQIRDII